MKKTYKNTIIRLLAVAASFMACVSAWAAAPTVYFYCTNSSSINLWTWKDGDTNTHYYGTSWPGNAMVAVEGLSGWYKATLDPSAEGVSYYFIASNGGVQTANLGPVTGNTAAWFDNNSSATTKGAIYDAGSYTFWGNWGTAWGSGLETVFDYTKLGFRSIVQLSAGTYQFRWKYNGEWSAVKYDTNSRGNVTLGDKVGENGTFTISEESNVFLYVDPGMGTVFVDAEPVVSTVPTVFIAKDAVVDNYDVTLSGYLKYTGCGTMTEYGFIYSTNEADINADSPTGTEIKQSGSLEAGSSYSLEKTGLENGTYYYRSYVKVDGNYYYSPKSDIGVFVINGECIIDHPVAVIDKTSMALTAATATVNLSTETNASFFNWAVVSQPAAATVTFGSQTARNTTVDVNAAGDYTFKLQVKCNEGDEWKDSDNTVSLHVCVAPIKQQLYLDGNTSNVICPGEKSVATIISQEGYDYTLYSNSRAAESYGTLVGTGETLTWRNIVGDGFYTVLASEHGSKMCEAEMLSATQSQNPATLKINASALSGIYYKSIVLSVDEEASTITGNPTWSISKGTAGYLLDGDSRLLYEPSKERASVEFKGGKSDDTDDVYQVTARATYTTSEPIAKTCETTAVTTITVSPATEDCN